MARFTVALLVLLGLACVHAQTATQSEQQPVQVCATEVWGAGHVASSVRQHKSRPTGHCLLLCSAGQGLGLPQSKLERTRALALSASKQYSGERNVSLVPESVRCSVFRVPVTGSCMLLCSQVLA